MVSFLMEVSIYSREFDWVDMIKREIKAMVSCCNYKYTTTACETERGDIP